MKRLFQFFWVGLLILAMAAFAAPTTAMAATSAPVAHGNDDGPHCGPNQHVVITQVPYKDCHKEWDSKHHKWVEVCETKYKEVKTCVDNPPLPPPVVKCYNEKGKIIKCPVKKEATWNCGSRFDKVATLKSGFWKWWNAGGEGYRCRNAERGSKWVGGDKHRAIFNTQWKKADR